MGCRWVGEEERGEEEKGEAWVGEEKGEVWEGEVWEGEVWVEERTSLRRPQLLLRFEGEASACVAYDDAYRFLHRCDVPCQVPQNESWQWHAFGVVPNCFQDGNWLRKTNTKI